MVSWGTILALSVSALGGLSIAGMALDAAMLLYAGHFGLAFGALSLAILLKKDSEKQDSGRLSDFRVWSDKAWLPPDWATWALRALMLTLIVEAQLLLNKLAAVG